MADIPQQVVDAILAGVRTATVDVLDVSPEHDYSKLRVTVVSPFFDGVVNFKRRDMVNRSLNGLRSEPGFRGDVVEMLLYSPAEVGEATSPDETAPEESSPDEE